MNDHEEACNKKAGKFSTVLFCFWVVAAMLMVQTAAVIVGIMPKVMTIVKAVGPDSMAVRDKVMNYMQTSSNLTLYMFVAELVCLLVSGTWYYYGYVKKDRENGSYGENAIKFDGIKSAAFVLTGCIAAWSMAVIIQRIVAALFPQTAENVGAMLGNALGGNMVLGIITAVVLAPIFEEITVRGIILRRSKRAFGVIGCIVISAFMFGVFHLNIIQGLYVLPLGLFWGFVGYRFNSVIPCIFCHMLNNFLGVLIPASVNPVILFILTGSIAAFVGVRFGYFDINKEQKQSDDITGGKNND